MQTTTYFILFYGELDIEQLNQFKLVSTHYSSLYRGGVVEDTRNLTPYLFEAQDITFFSWYKENGWRFGWGITIKSYATFDELYKHIRKFLIVQDEAGKRMYFHFYDPYVLRLFLPSCDSAQLKEFFGPVEQFTCEDEDPAYGLVFSLNNYNLIVDRIPKEEVFAINDTAKTPDQHLA